MTISERNLDFFFFFFKKFLRIICSWECDGHYGAIEIESVTESGCKYHRTRYSLEANGEQIGTFVMRTDSGSRRCQSKAPAKAWSQHPVRSNKSAETRHLKKEGEWQNKEWAESQRWEIQRPGHSERGLSSKSKADFPKRVRAPHISMKVSLTSC